MAKYGGGFGGGMNMQAMMQQAKKLQEQMAASRTRRYRAYRRGGRRSRLGYH